MSEPTTEERIHEVIERMVGRPKTTNALDPSPVYLLDPFGASKSPMYNSHAEFEAARTRNLERMSANTELFGLLRTMSETDREHYDRHASRYLEEEFGFADTRILGFDSVVDALMALQKAFSRSATRRLGMLAQERAAWWATKGRKRDPRAYQIASQLAYLYVLYRSEMPTYGENYGVPTGRYAKALEEIYQILGIKRSTIRGPAEAAIKRASEILQLHEEMQREFDNSTFN